MKGQEKAKRSKKEARQEEQGRKLVNAIFVALIVLAIIFMVYSASVQ